jgi:(2Fe-2S) ferredoxin
MTSFKRHIFFCTNQRVGAASCSQYIEGDISKYAKQAYRTKKPEDGGDVHISRAGCLNQCKHGPVAVVYPEGIWYSYLDHSDIDEIISSHLVDGIAVERLMIKLDNQLIKTD